MKRQFFAIGSAFSALLSLLLTTGCSDDFLDRKPQGQAIEGEIAVGGFEASAFGLYGILRGDVDDKVGISGFPRVLFQSIRSDDSDIGSSPGDGGASVQSFEKFEYTATNEKASQNWNDHYDLIDACNKLINDIEVSGDTSNPTMVNKAEAQLLRAWAYFELRRDFGQVPLVTKPIVNIGDGNVPKAEIATIDALIKTDCEFAESKLPTTWAAYPGRATSGFAKTLLAKLYLYQKNWAASLAKSEEVIASGVYSLESYATLFSDEGDNTKESIFEIQQLYYVGAKHSDKVYNNYWGTQGIRATGDWNLGWGFNVPSSGLLAAYENTITDKRYVATVLHEGEGDGFGLTVPTGLNQKYWNKKAYSNPKTRDKMGTKYNYWSNIKVFRYADIILMAAEAANESGNTASATTYLNQIRTRAGLSATTAASQADLRKAIKQERRIEFALEGERFYDLVRWGDASTELGSKGYTSKHALYPIPQIAIDKSQGVLVQNPNY